MKSTSVTAESAAPDDSDSVTITIRPGNHDPEASLFARELYDMYRRYSDLQGWAAEQISYVPDLPTGVKGAVMLVKGRDVYEHLKYETGVHRVQRVPRSERLGRVRTSTASVAVQLVAKGRAVTPSAESLNEKIRTYNFLDN